MPDSTAINASIGDAPQDDPLVAYAKALGAVVRHDDTSTLARRRLDVRKPDGAPGLSYAHISPLDPSPKLAKHSASLTIWEGAGCVKVRRAGQCHAGFVHSQGRGVVKTMSRASRRRLLYKIAQVRRSVVPDFVTLTYPGLYEGDPARSKRDLDTLGKRFARRGISAIWRLEYKERRSGASEGEAVPHFHLILWRPADLNLKEFQEWLSKAWYEVVDSGQPDHLAAGTSVEVMRSWRGVMSYSAKYIAKEDKSALPEGVGRLWGVINAAGIPWADMERVSITDTQCAAAYEFIKNTVGDYWRRFSPSRTVLVDSPERWLEYMNVFAAASAAG